MDRVNVLLDFCTPTAISFRNNISARVWRKNKNVEVLGFCFLILKLFPKIVVKKFNSRKLFIILEIIYDGFTVNRSEKSCFYLSYIYLNLVDLRIH